MSVQEWAELGVSLRTALQALAPVERTLDSMEIAPGWDPMAWARLSGDVALPALGIPEEFGGQGFGRAELGIALEETGRVLYPGPFLTSAVLAAGTLLLAGDAEASVRWLPGIASGDLIATVAHGVLRGRRDGVRAEPAADGTARLNGEVKTVLGVDGAGLLVVAAGQGDSTVLVAVELPGSGAVVEERSTMDLTRRVATVRLDGVTGVVLRTARRADEVLSAASVLASAAVASEQAGAARAALEMTVAYAGERLQFGREIGSFQSVRHHLADLFAEVELATAAARTAMRVKDPWSRELRVAALTAQSMCSETALAVAEGAIQLHGGIGFTWEHPAHLYFKRAKSSSVLLGGPESARWQLAAEILEGATV